jgi:hypothetical protein
MSQRPHCILLSAWLLVAWLLLLCHRPAEALVPPRASPVLPGGGARASIAAGGYQQNTTAFSTSTPRVRLLSSTPRKRRLHNYAPSFPRGDGEGADDDDDGAAPAVPGGSPFYRTASLSTPPPLSAQVRVLVLLSP